MKTTTSPETAVILAGYGFDVGQDFARASKDTPCVLARSEFAKPGCVIAYIDTDPSASLGFLKYGNRDGKVRVHVLERALKLPLDSRAEFLAFKVAHETAFSDLCSYSADDFIDFERLRPLMACDTMAGLIAARGCLEAYLACSCFIEELHSALVARAKG